MVPGVVQIDPAVIDQSCLVPKVEPEDQEAILTGVARALTKVSPPDSNGPRYLQCLETYGFAQESGYIQAQLEIAKTDPSAKPKLSFRCVDDDEARPAFSEDMRIVTLALSQPDPIYYAAKTVHESGHFASIAPHEDLNLIEECCGFGSHCSRLEASANRRKTCSIEATIRYGLSAPSARQAALTEMLGQDSCSLAKPTAPGLNMVGIEKDETSGAAARLEASVAFSAAINPTHLSMIPLNGKPQRAYRANAETRTGKNYDGARRVTLLTTGL